MERLRRFSQYIFALIGNSYWLFPWKAPIYQGPVKRICFPGLNCYSCPAASMACPLGSIQNFLASFRTNLQAGILHPGTYVIGSMGLVGSVVGRMPCGWICPFGLIQEWLNRVPLPRIGLWRPLRWLRYVFLVVFVVLMPLFVVDALGYGSTWFCKLVCPAGTLEAGLPLVWLEKGLRAAVGWLFAWKLLVLLLIIFWSMVTSRPFCRVICPLGLFFGLFNRASWLRLRFLADRCVRCKACARVCPTGVLFFDGTDDINSTMCIRCLRCVSICPAGSVKAEFGPVMRRDYYGKKIGVGNPQ